jgi:superfamily I DNA and/or RNA helicase
LFELSSSFEKTCPETISKFNELEATLIVSLIFRFAKEFTFSEDVTIGVITFYNAQKVLIEKKLHKKGTLSLGNIRVQKHLVISVNSVDSFQGQGNRFSFKNGTSLF